MCAALSPFLCHGMFTDLAEHVQCGIVRFSGTKNGLVMVPAPQSAKLIALVFLKIPLPDAWLRTDAEASQTSPGLQARVTPTHNLLPIPTPPGGVAASGMFSSPNMQPYGLPSVSPSMSSVSPAAPPSIATSAPGGLGLQSNYKFGVPSAAPSSMPPAQQPFMTPTIQQPQLPQQLQPAPTQQQQQPPASFPSEGIAGMDFSELQRLLGPEQFAQIMSGV